MCQYIKDDGEQCGMSDEPFCRHHDDSGQAKLWNRMEEYREMLMGQIRQLGDAIEEVREEAESDAQSGFSPDWTPTTCEECESAVRVVCARLDEAAFQPDKVVPTLALTCPCGDSVHYDPTWDNVPKSEVPSKWLFEDDREGSWDTEKEAIV